MEREKKSEGRRQDRWTDVTGHGKCQLIICISKHWVINTRRKAIANDGWMMWMRERETDAAVAKKKQKQQQQQGHTIEVTGAGWMDVKGERSNQSKARKGRSSVILIQLQMIQRGRKNSYSC